MNTEPPNVDPAKTETRPTRRIRFGVRFLLIAMLVVAAYCAGWVSHRAWQLRSSGEGVIEVEQLPDMDVVILRGRPQDVQRVQRVIGDVENRQKP